MRRSNTPLAGSTVLLAMLGIAAASAAGAATPMALQCGNVFEVSFVMKDGTVYVGGSAQ